MITIDQAILRAMLASRFAGVMGEWLSPAEMAEVRRRNVDYGAACATHDFCDANMAMMEAFEAVMGREPVLGDDDDSMIAAQQADLDLMNAAWVIAKRDHFTD